MVLVDPICCGPVGYWFLVVDFVDLCVWGCRWWCYDALGQFCLCIGMRLCGDLLEVLLVLLAEDCFDLVVV